MRVVSSATLQRSSRILFPLAKAASCTAYIQRSPFHFTPLSPTTKRNNPRRKNAWDSSGGSEVLSSVHSNIPQGTKDYLADAKNKIFNRQHLRSPAVFFGIGEEKPFYLERIPSLVTERLRHNVAFFYLNYILLTAVLFGLTLLISPSAIIGLGLLGFAWMAVIKATSEGSMQVKGERMEWKMSERSCRFIVEKCELEFLLFCFLTTLFPRILPGITITQKQASIGMGGLSVLVLIWLLSHIFWWTLSTSGFLTGVHCLLRDASMHKDEEDRVEMQGDLSLDEEATFLNTSAGSMA
jgi:hypothetical protein